MTTITETIQPILPINYGPDIDRLTKILGKYQDWNDYLSRDLFCWGTDVIKTALEHRSDSVETITRIAQDQLAVLRNDILVNHLTREPLHDPVLQSNWTWERSIYTLYLNGSATSPFNKETMSSTPTTHAFAQEMIAWMQNAESTGSTALVRSSDSQLMNIEVLATNPQFAAILHFFYERLGFAERLKEHLRELQAEMADGVISLNECVAKMQEEDKELLAKAKADSEAHEEALKTNIDSINKTHKDTINGLEAEITAQNAVHEARVREFTAKMDSMKNASAEEKARLQKDLEKMKSEHNTLVADLHSQIDRRNREHAQTEENLRNKIAEISRTNNEKLASMEQEHQRNLSNMQGQISEKERQLNKIQAELNIAKEQIVRNTAEIENYKVLYVQYQAEMERLKRKADEAGDGCTIL